MTQFYDLVYLIVPFADCGASACFDERGDLRLSSSLLTPVPLEMPRLNYERFNGRKYNHFYAVGKKPGTDNDTMLVKVDIAGGGEVHTWSEDDRQVFEPVFVPRPGRGVKQEENQN